MPPALVLRAAGVQEFEEAVRVDDDARTLFREAGLDLDLRPDHPFSRAERQRWTRAAEQGQLLLASFGSNPAVGLLVLGTLGETRYLDQLSVRVADGRRGIGRALLGHAVAWAGRTRCGSPPTRTCPGTGPGTSGMDS